MCLFLFNPNQPSFLRTTSPCAQSTLLASRTPTAEAPWGPAPPHGMTSAWLGSRGSLGAEPLTCLITAFTSRRSRGCRRLCCAQLGMVAGEEMSRERRSHLVQDTPLFLSDRNGLLEPAAGPRHCLPLLLCGVSFSSLACLGTEMPPHVGLGRCSAGAHCCLHSRNTHLSVRGAPGGRDPSCQGPGRCGS